jgi:hypothetical protein
MTNHLRNRNRFFRVIFSRHIRDLKVIALLASSLVLIILYLWGRVLFGSTYTNDLDQILEAFYGNMDCLEMNSSLIGSNLMDPLEKARRDLVAARTKIQDVNRYLWKHVEKPSRLLQAATTSIVCVGDLNSTEASVIRAQLPSLTSYVRHLASTLAYTGSALSVWAVFGVFGTVFLTFGGWLYRTGDARMTAIDVVASEIFALCRAITNNRSVRNISKFYESTTPPFALAYLELQEEYHDFMQIVGQNLGFLDQSSVARITGFYTSLKIMRDRCRMLKNWAVDASSEKPSLASDGDLFWKGTLRQTIYDFLLCLENARIALHLLLEGDDLHDDSIFVCLMSEIRAFAFLKDLTDNATYISRRLEARLQPPVFRTHEELESYLHPAYAASVRKVCANYLPFYEDNVGKDVIEKLRQATAEKARPSASRHWGLREAAARVGVIWFG